MRFMRPRSVRNFRVLLLVAALALFHGRIDGSTGEPRAPGETMIVTQGELSLTFDEPLLSTYGIQVLTRSKSTAMDSISSGIDAGADASIESDAGLFSSTSLRGTLTVWASDGDPGSADFPDTRAPVIESLRIESPGAIRFLSDAHRSLFLNPTLMQSASGEWMLIDGLTLAPDVGRLFQVEMSQARVQPDTGRFLISGTLVGTRNWGQALATPELEGMPIGTIQAAGSLRAASDADSELTDLSHRREVAPQSLEGEKFETTPFDAEHPDAESAGIIGPDVIVADLYQLNNYGVVGSIAALSLGTTSCNIGDRPAGWVASTNNHPVIGQNMYRLENDRFEQIGMSWLKHGFYAVNGTLCSSACLGTNGSSLGVNCSDPYSANLNGTQSNLGPRYQVNPHTGYFPYPPANPSYSGILARRLQVLVSDLERSVYPSTSYFVEGQYILPDDASWGTADNNVSYRPAIVSGAGSSVFAQLTGTTFREDPAIRAWKREDPSVIEEEIRVPGDGLFIVAAKAKSLPDGFWRYEYAVYNMNVHRAAESFRVPIDPVSTIRAIGFHDVFYRSGEPFVGTDWSWSISDVSITWSTTPFAQNENANALRWGTLYNFRFEVNAPPQTTNLRLGLFRPGSPDYVEGVSIGPVTNAADCNGNEIPDGADIAEGTSADCNGDNIPDECTAYALEAVRIATGLNQPVYATSPPNDASRLFIAEQAGRIRILSGGNLLTTPFLDITDRVSTGGEQGLLSVAFDPGYAANGRFYVNYTDLSGHTVVSRFDTTADPNVADPQSEVVLKTIQQDGPAHNGGQLQFAPDGTLHVGMGDGAAGGDPNGRAQDSSNLLGKMLRLDVNAPPDYIPADNPYASPSLPLDEIWAFGVRNPWRFSFDRQTGDLYIADVGETLYDEINIEPASSVGGRNYGWRCMEASTCTGLPGCTCHAPSLTLPVLDHSLEGDDCSITGGYVYRGCAIPNLLGTYLYADYCSGRIRSFRYEGGSVVDLRDRTAELMPDTGAISAIVSFGEDADGELYIVSHAGSVYKIVPRDVPPDVCGNGVIELDEACDDGNLLAGDGCDPLCQIEPGLQNDDCADAMPISDESLAFDTSEAITDGPNESSVCNQNGYTQVGSDIWYCYTATCTGTATVSLCDSDYDTKLAVYEGCSCPPGSAPLACNDNACASQSEVVVPVEACETYMIRVGGYQGAAGPGTLTIACSPDPIVNDCNGNGIEDASDIACGTSTDGNGNGVPDACETTGDPFVGGRLYDKWWQELSLAPPATDHPLWAYRPDPVSNPATGADTWRCKECHGWDYKGVDGQYGSGSHRTGFPGVLGTTLEAGDLFTLLKEPPSNGGGTGVPNGHDYGTALTDPQVNDLVAFVLSGAIDNAPYIQADGAFVGDEATGQDHYQSGGSVPCMTCHGVDGTSINFGTYQEPVYLGTVAQDNPWELLHKIRFGQPAAPMPSWLAGGGTNQGASDIGKFIQLNQPTECVDDEQCDDGIACTVDSCGPLGRCLFTPTDALCADDGVFCNGAEVCDADVGCLSAGNPCVLSCDEETQCGCLPPLVETVGGRYLAITPQPADQEIPTGILVEPICAPELAKYLGAPAGIWNIAQPVNNPGSGARFTPTEWGGTVYAAGLDIVPGLTYRVYADCGAVGTPVLMAAGEIPTDNFGDIVGNDLSAPPNGTIDFRDITASVQSFKGSASAPPLLRADILGCVPDQIVNFIDITGVVAAFKGRTYAGGSLCPVPCP